MDKNSSKSEFKFINFPGVRLLIVVSAVIFIFYIFLVSYNYVSDVNNQKVSDKGLEVEKLLAEVANYNEILTMSAKMYAATSNDFWEKRYNINIDKLEVALNKTIKLASEEEQSRFAKKTDEANKRLIAIENQAISMVTSGDAPAADSLLSTSEYERNKTLYSAGIRDLSFAIRNEVQKEQKNITFNKLFFNAVGALLFTVAIFLAVSAIRRTAKYLLNIFEEKNKILEASEKEMKAIAEQQLGANQQLFLAQKQALKSCKQFRLQEGKITQIKLLEYTQNIQNLLQKVAEQDKPRLEYIRERLHQKFSDLKNDDAFDKNRFEQELIYYIEKLDIAEEKVRLEKHLEYLSDVLKDKASNGKKINFISQEIGREINTIGSKANDATIQRYVVEMKEELEKIKEQSLNIL